MSVRKSVSIAIKKAADLLRLSPFPTMEITGKQSASFDYPVN